MSEERKYGGHTAEEMKALVAAATPGPWFEQYEYDGGRTVCQMRSTSERICVNRAVHVAGNPWESAKENGMLIAAARNALPDLLARIEQLEADNGRLRTALEPFAEAAKHWEDPPGSITHDNVELWQRGKLVDYLTCGDLRKAKVALLSASARYNLK